MIEVVSYPTDLSAWDPAVAALQGEGVSEVSKEFYLELYGETTPVVDMDYAQVLPAGNPDGTPQTAQAAPIYEYWWTVGHGGFSEHREHFWDHLGAQAQDHDIWHDLNDETAARVYVFFPIDAGWRVKELISTVKYLTPIKGQHSLMEAASKRWKSAAPLVADAGQVAGMLSPIPGMAVASAGASTLLSAMSKLQVNNIPQADGFEWSTAKVSSKIRDHGVMHGVMWTLLKKMFTQLGGRITGSVALSFIPARRQTAGMSATDRPAFAPSQIIAHAVVYGSKRTVWVPDAREFIKLCVTPTSPS